MPEYSINLAGLFISAFISSTIAPGGSEAVLAYMVAERSNPIETLIIVATIGNTLGAMTTWLLGHWAALKFPVSRLLTENKQKSVIWVQKWGVWTLFFSWLPIVGDGLCFAAGWLKLPVISSCIIILLGKLGRYAFVVWAVNGIASS